MYNKLFAKILDSSIWLEMTDTRIVWITLLAAMDQDGYAHFSAIGNLANRARVSEEAASAAVECFLSPDPNSEDQEHDGRRIERVPGGFIVLNAQKYKELVTAETNRAAVRERVRRHRENKHLAGCNAGSNAAVTQSETETESDGQESSSATAPELALDGGRVEHDDRTAGTKKAKRLLCPFEKIVDLYHEMLPELPRCEVLTTTRRGYLQQRWRADLTDLDDWRLFFMKFVRTSPFLMGQSQPSPGRAPFRANLEWLTKPANYAKIIEGNYNGKARK